MMSEDSISYDEEGGNSLEFALLDEDHAFEHLFATNKAPSTEEAKAASWQITRSNQRLEAIQKEIQELKQRIEDLEDQDVQEQRRNCAYQRIVAPIKRIPDEMLGEIFKHLHSVDEGFPPSVSRICSRWRQVILKTPRLWTTINLFPTSNSIELAKLSAMRCGPTLPMCIIIHWGSKANSSLNLDWLVPYRPRIQKFAVSLSPVSDYIRRIHDEIEPPVRLPLIKGGSFDGLEELKLDVYEDNWDDVKRSFWNSSTKAHSLKKLHLISIGLPPADVGIPLDCLTHLVLEDGFESGGTLWDPRQILLFLTNHPLLQTVKLQDVMEYYEIGGSEFIAGLPGSPLPTTTHPSQYPSAESERITLPNLKSLSIDFDECTNWFLDRLTLPALKHLTLSGAVCWVPSFQHLAERSSFPLETFAMVDCTPFYDPSGSEHHADPQENLDMHRSEIRQQQVVDVLKSCPTIRELEAVDSLFLGTYLVERLRRKNGTSLLGPNLQHLCIGDTEIYSSYDEVMNKIQAEGEQVLSMLDSRQPDGKGNEICSRLQNFKLYHSGSPSIPISGVSCEELYKIYNRYQGNIFFESSRNVFF